MRHLIFPYASFVIEGCNPSDVARRDLAKQTEPFHRSWNDSVSYFMSKDEDRK